MKIQFITYDHAVEAVKYLASGGHLPYTDADGSPNHRLMGAAWAALHGGYRGNKYDGPDKDKAIAKLKAVYKSEKMDTPEESFALDGEFLQEALRKDDSFDSIRCAVMDAVNANIRAGVDMDGDDDGPQDAIEGAYAWCSDIFPGTVVYSMGGELFQCDYTINDDDSVTLGTPQAVEMSYTPVANDATESFRAMAAECTSLNESAYDAAKGELTITVIKPGMSKNNRLYPPDVLKRDFKIFEGVKMFADHQTDKQAKEQPEGSVNNWVANVKNVWPESDGTIKGTAVVIDPQFKAKLGSLNEAGMLKEMGVSIRAIGEAHDVKQDGKSFKMIESLIAARSVDFVTYAGAGGQVETMESTNDANDVDLIGEAELRKRRPDLVAIIESSAHGEENLKTVETQLKEASENVAALSKKVEELTAANKQLTESAEAGKKTVAAAELSKLLAESKLPEAAQKRLQKRFADATEVTGMKEGIDEEKSYLETITGGAKVSNMGSDKQGVTESDKGAKASIVESLVKRGFKKEDAEMFAAR